MPTDEQRAVELLGRVRLRPGGDQHARAALPRLARHIVVDGRVLLRMHRGHGYHRACAGSVVAYGADNLGSPRAGERHWSVQVVGACEAVEPTAAELDALRAAAPRRVDGEPFEPVYLRVDAASSCTVHSTADALEAHSAHS